MQSTSPQDPGMTSPATYQITVRGRLAKDWVDWFNGALIEHEQVLDGYPSSILTCRVRDQAELLGILNRLYSLSMPLVQVILH